MADKYNSQNIPTNPNFAWKAPPGYTPPSESELAILGSLGATGMSPQGMEAWNAMGNTGLGGYSTLAGFMPTQQQMGQYLGGAGRASELYEQAATDRLRQTGQQAYAQLQGGAGAAGNLGSTVHGIGGLDLAARYAGERNQIASDAAQMKEGMLANRMNTGIGALAQMGQLASYEQMNNANQANAMMSAAQQQQSMDIQSQLAALQAQQQYRMEPSQWAYDMWAENHRAPKSGGIGGAIMGGLGTAAQMYSMFNPVTAAAGGTGGGTSGGTGGGGWLDWLNK